MNISLACDHGGVELKEAIKAHLKKRGFTFVGTTIVYSLLQSAGLVDDHLKGCGWHASCRPPE